MSRRRDDVEPDPALDLVAQEFEEIAAEDLFYSEGGKFDEGATENILAWELQEAERSARWRPAVGVENDGVLILPANTEDC